MKEAIVPGHFMMVNGTPVWRKEHTRTISKAQSEASSRNLTKYNQSEKNRQRMIAKNKSVEGRRAAGSSTNRSIRSKTWRESQEGRKVLRECGLKTGLKNINAYNNSPLWKEKHIAVSRRAGSKTLSKLNKTTIAQRSLSKALSDVGIKNKMEWWLDGIYRIVDIAIPPVKLAIEVDGASHFDKKFIALLGQKLEDKRADDKLKDEQLKSLGWKVLRFTDAEVKNNLDSVVKKVRSSLC